MCVQACVHPEWAHLPHLFITGLKAVVLASCSVRHASLSSEDSVSDFPPLQNPKRHAGHICNLYTTSWKLGKWPVHNAWVNLAEENCTFN